MGLKPRPTISERGYQALTEDQNDRGLASLQSPDRVLASVGAMSSVRNQRLLAFAIHNNDNDTPNPLPASDIDALRMQHWRDRTDELVALTQSLKLLLAYDRDLCFGDRAFFSLLFARRIGTVIGSPTMTQVCSEDGMIGAGFEPKGDFAWTDGPDMPALVEFPLGAHQRVFMYIGEPDGEGEYPIVRFDNQPELWLTRGCLHDAIVRKVAGSNGRQAAAEERNDRFLKREWFRKD